MKYKVVSESKQDFKNRTSRSNTDEFKSFVNNLTNYDTSDYTASQILANDVNDGIFKVVSVIAPQQFSMPITGMKYAVRGMINDTLEERPSYINFNGFHTPDPQQINLNYFEKVNTSVPNVNMVNQDQLQSAAPQMNMKNDVEIQKKQRRNQINNRQNERKNQNVQVQLRSEQLKNESKFRDNSTNRFINRRKVQMNQQKLQSFISEIPNSDTFNYKKMKQGLKQLNQSKVNQILRKKIENQSREPFVVRSTYLERMAPENIILLANLNPKVI